MMIQNYLKYVHKNLGLSGVMLNPEVVESSANLSIAPKILPAESLAPVFHPESTYLQTGRYAALFLRVGDAPLSLSSDPEAEELFSKLRWALGFKPESAPWLEVSLAHWQQVLQMARQQAPRVILMLDDCLERGINDRPEWIIPDPSVLVQQVELKRPTWELLKEWKS